MVLVLNSSQESQLILLPFHGRFLFLVPNSFIPFFLFHFSHSLVSLKFLLHLLLIMLNADFSFQMLFVEVFDNFGLGFFLLDLYLLDLLLVALDFFLLVFFNLHLQLSLL